MRLAAVIFILAYIVAMLAILIAPARAQRYCDDGDSCYYRSHRYHVRDAERLRRRRYYYRDSQDPGYERRRGFRSAGVMMSAASRRCTRLGMLIT